MRKKGKISPIKKEYNSSQLQTMQSELSKKGRTRVPGTGVFKYPYKEFDGKYRTGLDPDAAYIKRISDDTAREIEKERVTKLRKKLEEALSLDLSPTSKFWNHALSTSTNDMTHVQPVKLMDDDNLFDLGIAWQELNYAWLRVHPTIASSYQAWERGEFPADTQFYVADDEIETAVAFKKKQAINKAIVAFDAMTPERRKKIARVMGLPVTDDSREDLVYNLVDNLLKQSEFKSGKFQGLSPVQVFTRFAELNEKILTIKDLVKQAITHSVYRVKPNGKLFKGEYEVAADEDALVKYLADEDKQDELILLEQELKGKKLVAI